MSLGDVVTQIFIVACREAAEIHRRHGCCATWIMARHSLKKYFEPEAPDLEAPDLELEARPVGPDNPLRWN